MITCDKFYYIKSTFSDVRTQLIRWNPYYSVGVAENVDFRQCINFDYDKLKAGIISKPTSSEYEKVKPIVKEVFLNLYIFSSKKYI